MSPRSRVTKPAVDDETIESRRHSALSRSYLVRCAEQQIEHPAIARNVIADDLRRCVLLLLLISKGQSSDLVSESFTGGF
jgi:hypothetical protein